MTVYLEQHADQVQKRLNVRSSKKAKGEAPLELKSTRTYSPQEGEEELRGRLYALRGQMRANYLERGELIDVAITAMVAKTNAVLIGSPGTGKTRLIRDLIGQFGLDDFYYLLSATTQPDEIIGSLDLGELQNNSVFRRDLSGRVADVQVAILDEVFKANSPCLNSLLEIMLDKTLTNGKDVIQAPLVTMYGMSNELPEDEELAPFWDRFALRCHVAEIPAASQKLLMMRRAGLASEPMLTEQITYQELELMQQQAQSLPIPESVIDAALDLVRELKDNAGIVVSTRKMVQMIPIISAYAYVRGANSVDEDHLAILKYILWSEIDQIPEISKAVDNIIAAAIVKYDNILNGIKDSVRRWESLKPKDGGAFYEQSVRGSETRSASILIDLEEELQLAVGRKAKKIEDTIKAIKQLRAGIILPRIEQLDELQAQKDNY